MNLFRKLLLGATSVLVVVYSAGVLHRTQTSWELGVHCLLSDEANGLLGSPGQTIGWVGESTEVRGIERPQTGDRLLRVAGVDIPTFMHFKYRICEINPAVPIDSYPGIASPNDLASLTDDVALADVPMEDGALQRWARLDFLRLGGDDHPVQLQAWVPLKAVPSREILFSLAWFLLEMIILGIGALVVWKRPGDASANLFFALCIVSVVTFMGEFHWPSLVGSRVLIYPFIFCAILLAPMTLHFYLLFPRPVAFVRRWPVATSLAVYGLPVIWIVLMFRDLLQIDWQFEEPSGTDALAITLDRFTTLVFSYLAVSTGMFLVGQGVLIHGFVYSRAPERSQYKWLLGAVLLAAVPVGYLLYEARTDRAEFAFGPLPKLMIYTTSLMFTVAYAVSITRYKLMGVGRLVNRGILYVAISFAATVVFCLMVGLATALVGRIYFSWENALMAGITAMLVVVFLGWIRDRFQRALDRRFFQEKYRLDKAIRQLGEAVGELVEPKQLARQLVQSARDAIGADRGAVYLLNETGSQFELAYRTGWPALPGQIEMGHPLAVELSRPGDDSSHRDLMAASAAARQTARDWQAAMGCPLELDGSAVGLLLLGPKEGGIAYTNEDCNFVVALTRTTTLALHSAQRHQTIASLQTELSEKLHKIAEQRQRISFLQGELLNRADLEPPGHARHIRVAGASGDRLEHQIRGSSQAVRDLLGQVAKVALSPSSVLIRGESGTGKELLAQAIHANSPRARGPFVQVHCAALSPGLLESELFGHVKGAFTGADRDKVGRFELADGGTLFLDEIGDINLETQTKLLRVLQERTFERVGSTQTMRVDVRLIAATHQDLEELIRQGRFREDLFYRLNVISLRVPALRERREDVFELAVHFLRVYADRAGKAIRRIDDEALEVLASCAWPGNIRQLENAIERAVVLAEGDALGLGDLPPEIVEAAPILRPRRTKLPVNRVARRLTPEDTVCDAIMETTVGSPRLRVVDQRDEAERGRIEGALSRAAGNKAEAARLLGIPRSTLFSKLRKLGME